MYKMKEEEKKPPPTKEIKLTANSLPQHYMFGEMRYVNLPTLQNISFTLHLHPL